nr:hypothetical protein [Tanacetum cinerariifolium]
MIFKPRQATIPFHVCLYDDCYGEEKGLYRQKVLDAYLIGTTLCDDALPQKEKDPGSSTLPCYINNVCFKKSLADLGASVSIMPLSTYLNLGLGELDHTKLTVELAYRTVKHPKGIAKNVLVGIELRRNRVDDLAPTVKECEVINEPMIDIVKTRCNFLCGLDDYPSDYDFDRRIHIDCAYNVKFSCMTDKIGFKRRNELGNFINAPVFIGNFYVITDFTVVEDMDPYLNEGIRDAIVREHFCKASDMEAKWFKGIITIHDEDDSVTYQMVRSNLSFKHLTNEKCNRIPPLLKTDPYSDTF